ncbi:amidohydrolase [Paenarthrobacter aurescens]|uniref:Amidohydrolase n=1 Tax=Paenarthrobacter aurescens TaxID=43663 RepID=A0A4Y3NNG7_PAEAU|nr:amidohydrolase [Paenarthrobacter aurescens]MDO6142411.1 amidohydrolase [Paenarthrobacter aurescens]MDO6146258.1 amidohydrolase [Paenarthrobacter aurescens]MDO6157503.1 amidohydrolase [Paenarthrobacter aurescens]MDO6161488.1 amidohydrolase [Paenarthrobacter aurescens]GEB20598.1 amidohydrolase [Paenarthrobacter aurescens]
MHAEILFENGWVYTGNDAGPLRANLAIAKGRIIAVGQPEDVNRTVTPETTRVDLDGQLVIPGFQDAHIHPIFAGIELLQCDLTQARSAEEAVAAVARYAADNPDEPWISGAGWSMDFFPGGTPTRQLLDAVVPDRPVYLINRDHHGAWANTAAFAAAGISADTPDPEGGRLEREEDGTPAGTVHEGAMDLFNAAKPPVPYELAYRGLLASQQLLLAQGITAWQDAWVPIPEGGHADHLNVYTDAVKAGDLKVRVTACQWWDRTAGMGQLQEIVERRDRVAGTFDHQTLNANTVKVMVDGVAENYTAAMHHVYLDHHGHPTENRGIEFFAPDELKEFVTAIDASGMQVHFHALGDRAVTDALDALEAARDTNGVNDNRHHLAHLQLVRSEDVPRFAALNAAANVQALWACHEEQMDTLTLPFLEPGAEDRHYPFGELASAGARLVAGSDWPVSTADPIAAMHVAVNRAAPEEDLPPLGPESQKLSVKQILDAYTHGSAWINHLDAETGTLEPGKLADLAVLNLNIFDLPAQELHRAEVTQTWIGGECVYDRSHTGNTETLPVPVMP